MAFIGSADDEKGKSLGIGGWRGYWVPLLFIKAGYWINDNFTIGFQSRRRKREYSKLVMIYEEDAPLPPPDEDASLAS